MCSSDLYVGGTFAGCSFDSEKNSGLTAAGIGTISSGVEGGSTNEVLANICEDYYGGHKYSSDWTVDTAATCTKDGSKSQHCERCDAKGNITVIPATGHTFEWVIDKEATATEAGSKHEECTVCGYAKAAVEIPATGASESSQTGDDSNIALLAGLLVLAAAVAAGTVVYGRKRREQ